MPAVQTAKEVIEQVKAFHVRLGNFYQDLSDKVEQERVKVLLEYMSRHHDSLAYIMAEYESDISEHVLDTWFMFVSKECDLSPYFSTDFGPDMTVQQVIQVAMDLDKCLLSTYEAMQRNDVSEDVAEVFKNLLEMEKAKQVTLAKNVLMLEDM